MFNIKFLPTKYFLFWNFVIDTSDRICVHSYLISYACISMYIVTFSIHHSFIHAVSSLHSKNYYIRWKLFTFCCNRRSTPVSQPASQSVSHPASQPTSQLVSQNASLNSVWHRIMFHSDVCQCLSNGRVDKYLTLHIITVLSQRLFSVDVREHMFRSRSRSCQTQWTDNYYFLLNLENKWNHSSDEQMTLRNDLFIS